MSSMYSSSSGTSDSEMNELCYGLPSLTDSSKFSNERLCSALLWSAKVAAKNQQKVSQNRRLHWKNPALYKTRLCDYWSTGSPCKFGIMCWYAHGPTELRHVPRLDRDPIATSISLAEVVQCLPPSEHRKIALEQVENQLMANMFSEALSQHMNQSSTSPSASPPTTECQSSSPESVSSIQSRSKSEAVQKTGSTGRLPLFEQISARGREQRNVDIPFAAWQPYMEEAAAYPEHKFNADSGFPVMAGVDADQGLQFNVDAR